MTGGNREEYYVSLEEFKHLKEIYVHTNDCLFKAKDISLRIQLVCQYKK